MPVYKTALSRYANIAFCENRHVSAEAQLILNSFQVYKILIIQITIIEKKENILKPESRMFMFLCAYATVRQKWHWCRFLHSESVPGIMSETNFKHCVSDATCFDVIYKKVNRSVLIQTKMSDFWANMATTVNISENDYLRNCTIPFTLTHFKLHQTPFGRSCVCFVSIRLIHIQYSFILM